VGGKGHAGPQAEAHAPAAAGGKGTAHSLLFPLFSLLHVGFSQLLVCHNICSNKRKGMNVVGLS